MASTIWEFFGYRVTDSSENALHSAENEKCPITKTKCEKTIRGDTMDRQTHRSLCIH